MTSQLINWLNKVRTVNTTLQKLEETIDTGIIFEADDVESNHPEKTPKLFNWRQ